MLNTFLTEITKNKQGVEIGGHSFIVNVIYENAASIDNVIFSKNTIWATHIEDYYYYNDKKGKVIIYETLKGNL